MLDLPRFQNDLRLLTPGDEVQLLNVIGFAKNFRNGYIESYTAGIDHDFGDVKFSFAYVATAGVRLASVYSPNSFGGADPGSAPFTQFDSTGKPVGGFGPEFVLTSGSHSTYHSLQSSLSKNSALLGLGLQGSYTYSKSLDDTSSVLGGLAGTAGMVLQTLPQDPWNPEAEKGPSTFDVTHVFTLGVIQLLPLDRIRVLQPLRRPLTRGWQFLNITTLTTGSPFSVVFRSAANGRGSGGAQIALTRWKALIFRPEGRCAKTISAAVPTTHPFFTFPSTFPAAPGRTMAGLAPWAETHSEGRASMTLTLRWSRTRPSGTGETENWVPWNSARSSSMSST
jgi:hypothetical protein